jgi:hypothetical protein
VSSINVADIKVPGTNYKISGEISDPSGKPGKPEATIILNYQLDLKPGWFIDSMNEYYNDKYGAGPTDK